ncbi:MAG: hypothetical protein GYB65_19470, partial [Chloroflexi bacterium]|nr:hypothetical protein [Chloroflexota bacterium]
MADQPNSQQPIEPGADDNTPDIAPSDGWQKPEIPPQPWHEPPVSEESSRPMIVEAWFPTENADEILAASMEEPAPKPPVVLPASVPEQAGSWFTPLDAQLESLLSEAADTIAETHEAKPLPQAPQDEADSAAETQPQVAAEARAAEGGGGSDDTPEESEPETPPATPSRPIFEGQAAAAAAMAAAAAARSQALAAAAGQAAGQPAVEQEAEQVEQDEAVPAAETPEEPAAQADQTAVAAATTAEGIAGETVLGAAAEVEAQAAEVGQAEQGEAVEGAQEAEALATAEVQEPGDSASSVDTAELPLEREAQAASDDQATPVDGAAPAVDEDPPPADATPAPRATRGLSPAEAAFLAEKRSSTSQQTPAFQYQYEEEVEASAAEDSQPLADVPPASTARQEPLAATQPPQPTPYEQVERKVSVLRERYQTGHLTRDQLQNELRNLMILDDDGHWWMLGLESNRWYFYDGRTWSPGVPPGYQEPVRGSAVKTDTGLQQVIDESTGPYVEREPIEIDEDGMPLPARVPQDDLGATLVSP